MNKKNNNLKKISAVLAIVMLLSLILSFPGVAKASGKVIKVSSDKILNTSRTVLGVAVGLFLINAGVVALVVPWVGIALIAVGVVLVAYSVWPLFTKKSDLGMSR